MVTKRRLRFKYVRFPGTQDHVSDTEYVSIGGYSQIQAIQKASHPSQESIPLTVRAYAELNLTSCKIHPLALVFLLK